MDLSLLLPGKIRTSYQASAAPLLSAEQNLLRWCHRSLTLPNRKTKALPRLGWSSSRVAGCKGCGTEALSSSHVRPRPSCSSTLVLRSPLAAGCFPGLPSRVGSTAGSGWRGQRCVPDACHIAQRLGPSWGTAEPLLPKAFCTPGRNVS